MMTQEINPRTGKLKYAHHGNNPDIQRARNVKSNPNRMYVDGKYIKDTHPLHKPGRYTSFGDAAFTALQKDAQVKEGYVYVITNPAWPEWVKIGMAIDAEDRLKGYQTSSPMRDYTLVHYAYSDDRNVAERQAHVLAGKLGDRRNEWFKINNEDAVIVIEQAVSEEMEIA